MVRTAGRTDPLQPGRPLYYLGRAEDALRSFERALSLNPDLGNGPLRHPRAVSSLRGGSEEPPALTRVVRLTYKFMYVQYQER